MSTAVVAAVLWTCLSDHAPAPSAAPAGGGATGPTWIRPIEPNDRREGAPAAPGPPRQGLVFAFLPAVTAGISLIPSLDFPLYLGARLPRRPWALGYQFTFSTGFAERYFLGILTHRHHVTAMRSFGVMHRGFVSIGGGLALLAIRPVIEVEGRAAVRFGKRRRGLFGGLARLGWNVGYRELAPMPQFGLFVGVTTL